MTPTETAIFNHATAILRVLTALAGLMGVAAGGVVQTVPRHVYRTVLRRLRPAESAVRRLIVVWGQNLLRGAYEFPSQPGGAAVAVSRGKDRGERVLGFPLFDRQWQIEPSRRTTKGNPRILLLDGSPLPPSPALPPEPKPDDPMDAARLLRRMQAMRRALDDLPGHAERMAKALARRRAAPPGPRHRFSPIRGGRPPGHLAKPRHAIDHILDDCQYMARVALNDPQPSSPKPP